MTNDSMLRVGCKSHGGDCIEYAVCGVVCVRHGRKRGNFAEQGCTYYFI